MAILRYLSTLNNQICIAIYICPSNRWKIWWIDGDKWINTHTLPNQVFGLTFWPKYQRSFAYALVWPFSRRNLRKIHFYSRAMRDWKMVINKLQLQTLLTTYIYHGRCYDSIQDQPMQFQNQAFHADLNCVFRRRENQLKKNSTQQIFETKP